jgi:hypothetical protein
MLYYLIHKSPLWRNSNITDGQRNVRILFVVLILYIILHATIRSYNNNDHFLAKFVNGYFWYFIAIDIFVCAIDYRTYYGRSITAEFKSHETDHFDEKTHKYQQVQPIKPTKEIPIDSETNKINSKLTGLLNGLSKQNQQISTNENESVSVNQKSVDLSDIVDQNPNISVSANNNYSLSNL